MKPEHLCPALRQRLLQRVRASHAHERQFLTVRREPVRGGPPASGVRLRTLAHTAMATSSLVELHGGAVLDTDAAHTMFEAVVLEGSAFAGDFPLACGDALLAPHDAAHALRAGPSGTRLYLRRSRPATAPAELACFSTLDARGWDDFCPGVRIRSLWEGGERRSVLVHMHPGARVNAHVHALEEECMMLAGEAFIGDTLLRSGEYQLAPQGSRHGEITTDVGALFFVHGSLDPAAYA